MMVGTKRDLRTPLGSIEAVTKFEYLEFHLNVEVSDDEDIL